MPIRKEHNVGHSTHEAMRSQEKQASSLPPRFQHPKLCGASCGDGGVHLQRRHSWKERGPVACLVVVSGYGFFDFFGGDINRRAAREGFVCVSSLSLA